MSGVQRIVIGAGLIGATVLSGGSGGVGLAAYLSSSVAASTAFNIGLSLALGGVAETLAGRPKTPPTVVSGNVRGSSETHLIVLGERRVGGKLVSLGTAGNNNRDLYIGLAHSVTHAGGCEGLTGFWFDDTYVPLANLGSLTGSTDVSFGDLAGQVNLAFYRGTDTQLADAASVAAGVDSSTDYRRRICWTRALLRMSSDDEVFNAAFPGGIPTLNAVLRGWRCYDPRLDTTAGGSGSQRANNPLTWTWTRNPALCASTYWIVPRLDGGCGRAIDTVDWASVAAAANVCDELISTPAGMQPRFRCDLVLDTRDKRRENLQKILDTMGGRAPRIGRIRKFYAAAYRNPTATIDATWLRGPVVCTPLQPIDNLSNTIRARFPDETNGFKDTDTPPFAIASAVTADGEPIDTQVSFDGVVRPYGAQYLTQIILKRARRQEQIELPCNWRGLDVEEQETVTLDIPELGSPAVYRVIAWRWRDGLPYLVLRADAASDYTPETFSVPPPPVTVTTGASTPIGIPQALTAAGISGAVLLNWRSPAGTIVADPLIPVYLIERTYEDENTWVELARVTGFSFTDSSVTASDTFSYRIRAVNQRGQAGTPSNIATAGALQAGGPIATSVQNPGFESGNAGWVFSAGWDVIQRTLTGGGRFGVSVNPARTGLWSARHTGPASTALNAGFVAVSAGQRVTAQAWFYRDDAGVSASGFVRLNWYDATGAALSSVNGPTVLGAIPGGGASFISRWTASTVSLAVAPVNAAFARVEISAAGNIRADDVSLTVSSIASLDDVPDSASFARVNAAELTSGVPKLSIAGARTLPPRNVPAVRHAGIGSLWTGPLNISSTFDAANPANVTLSASAATLNAGGFSSSFAASSVSVTQPRGTTQTWRLYYEGAQVLGGGTFALIASTSEADLVGGANRAFVGRITVTVPATGSGTGAGGTPGGGGGGVIP